MSEFVCCVCSEQLSNSDELEDHINIIHWEIFRDSNPFPDLICQENEILNIDAKNLEDFHEIESQKTTEERKERTIESGYEENETDQTGENESRQIIEENNQENEIGLIIEKSLKERFHHCPSSNVEKISQESENTSIASSSKCSPNSFPKEFRGEKRKENKPVEEKGKRKFLNLGFGKPDLHNHEASIKSFFCYFCKFGGKTIDELDEHLAAADHRRKERNISSPIKQAALANKPPKKESKNLEGVFVSLEEFFCQKCDFRLSTSRPLFYCPTHKLECQGSHLMKPTTPNKVRNRKVTESEIPIRHIESLADQVNELIISAAENTELRRGSSNQRNSSSKIPIPNPNLKSSNIERRTEEKVKRNLNFEFLNQSESSNSPTKRGRESQPFASTSAHFNSRETDSEKESKNFEMPNPKRASSFCQICSRQYSGPSSLRRHIRRIHSGEVQSNPDQQVKPNPDQQFQPNPDQLIPQANLVPINRLSCEICQSEFESDFQLNLHLSQIHKLEDPSLDRTNPDPINLLSRKIKIEPADGLPDQMGESESLKQDSENKIVKDSSFCNSNQNKFGSQSNHRKRKLSQEKEELNHFQETILPQSETEKLKVIHSNVPIEAKRAKIVRSATPLFCRICQKKFNSATLLRVHVVKTHPVHPPQRSESKVEVEKVKTFKNVEQKGEIKELRKNNVEQKVEAEKVKTKTVEQIVENKEVKKIKVEPKIEPNFVKNESSYCYICHYQFPSIANLLRHEKRKHLDGEKFNCPECSKEFKLEYDMKRHLRNVHGKTVQPKSIQNLLSCRFCRIGFKMLADFETHLFESHKNEIDRLDATSNDSRCHICFRTFPDGLQMIEHVVESHRKLPFVCHLCGKQFVVSEGFVHHFTSAHLNVEVRNSTSPSRLETRPRREQMRTRRNENRRDDNDK